MRRFLLLSITSFMCFSVSAQTVSIRADEWFPMNGEPDTKPAGFLIDLAVKTFGDIDYKLLPWQRAVEDARTGKVDCVVGAYKEDVPDFVFPEENWGVDRTGVYVMADDAWQYKDISSLLDRKVGVIKGYSYEEEIDQLIEKRQDVFKVMSGVSALEKNIKKLSQGRIDTFIESEPVANAKILAMGLKGKFKRVAYTNTPSAMYIACSPAIANAQELVDKVDEATRAMRASGEIDEIMDQYGLTDWKE